VPAEAQEIDGKAAQAGAQTMDTVVRLGRETLTITEIGFVKDALKLSTTEEDLHTTGAFLWAASLVLSQWVVDELAGDFAGKRVVELGAGCGLPGITSAACTEASTVVVTDLASDTFANTERNVAANQADGRSLTVGALDWLDKASWPASIVASTDVIIGSDLVYDRELVAPLVDVIVTSLGSTQGGKFFYVSADDDRAGC